MAGAEAQAGFYYQNIVAAQYALDLIEFGSQLRSITLENSQRAKHIDDIIVDRTEGASFIQVKWSEDDTTAFTLHNLVLWSSENGHNMQRPGRFFRPPGDGHPREDACGRQRLSHIAIAAMLASRAA